MRNACSLLAMVVALGASAGCTCSRGMRVPRDAAGAEASITAGPEAGRPALPDAGPTTGPEGGTADLAWPGAEVLSPEAGADSATDAPVGPDTVVAPPEVGADAAAVVWTGPDAVVTIGTPPPSTDGGIVPQVYAFPAAVLVSHTKLYAALPDVVFRIDELGDVSYLDLDGDRLGDLVLSKTTAMSFYRQDPAGGFHAVSGITLAAKDYYDRFALGDLDGDGLADVVMAYHPSGDGYHSALAVYRQTAAGFPAAPDQIVTVAPDTSACDRVSFLTTDDMNGDGRPDLVALTRIQQNRLVGVECSYETNVVQVFWQDAAGLFRPGAELAPTSPSASCTACSVSAAVGDIDRDGRNDLAILQDGTLRSDVAPRGFETLVYTQAGGAFAADPVHILTLGQFLRSVRLFDVDGDGRLDVLVRPGKPQLAPDLSATTPGLSGVFLQQADGSFASAQTVTPDGWLPAGTEVKTQPVGIDIRDVDGDRIRDLVLERNSVVEGLFRQEQGRFASTPDLELQALFPDLVAASQQLITVSFLPADGGSVSTTGRFHRLAYALADMDGDGREDVVVSHAPFAPNLAPDPATGKYPYPGFQPNTYTEIRIHRQRPLARRFLVVVEQAEVTAESVLRIRATIRNLTEAAADDVMVRVLASSTPGVLSYTREMLVANFDAYAAWGRDFMLKNENRIKGAPLGSDILIPRIEAGATIPLAIEVPVALVDYLDLCPLFLVVDPDASDNLLYKRSYPFIAAQ